MSLRLYNTLTRKKETFEPLEAGKVRMYVCGITAYDLCHVGHARALVVFDVIYRHLLNLGYDVNFIQNFTDVDDKIINRANEEGISALELSEKYISEFFKDIKHLNIKEPTERPKVSDNIPCIVKLIERIIDAKIGYEVEGDVYFSVRDFPGYGKLSGKNIEELEAGARVEIGEKKRDPLDFALWKKAKPGEPKWESPWGEGRPGWHIECSAMSQKCLGFTFDIHGGGRDLIFPHHENEIAQAEAGCGQSFSKYWLHNGFVNINKEKMSKSLDNFFTIREILEDYHPESLRLFLLSTHYRSPIDFSEEALKESKARLDRLNVVRRQIEEAKGEEGKVIELDSGQYTDEDKEIASKLNACEEQFTEAMNDDFNTALALGHLFEIARSINKWFDSSDKIPAALISQVESVFEKVKEVFGIFYCTPTEWFQAAPTKEEEITPEQIESLIAERKEARGQKNFARADEIRNQLADQGVLLEDSPKGTIWKRK